MATQNEINELEKAIQLIMTTFGVGHERARQILTGEVDRPAYIPPAPPGFAWATDPITGQRRLVDTTPLDPSKPLAGWHWVIADPRDDTKGSWQYFPDPSVIDDPFRGVPESVVPWLKKSLDAGGDLNVVPEGAARSWVQYLMAEAGREAMPGQIPFGLGLPNFEPEMPGSQPTQTPAPAETPTPQAPAPPTEQPAGPQQPTGNPPNIQLPNFSNLSFGGGFMGMASGAEGMTAEQARAFQNYDDARARRSGFASEADRQAKIRQMVDAGATERFAAYDRARAAGSGGGPSQDDINRLAGASDVEAAARWLAALGGASAEQARGRVLAEPPMPSDTRNPNDHGWKGDEAGTAPYDTNMDAYNNNPFLGTDNPNRGVGLQSGESFDVGDRTGAAAARERSFQRWARANGKETTDEARLQYVSELGDAINTERINYGMAYYYRGQPGEGYRDVDHFNAEMDKMTAQEERMLHGGTDRGTLARRMYDALAMGANVVGNQDKFEEKLKRHPDDYLEARNLLGIERDLYQRVIVPGDSGPVEVWLSEGRSVRGTDGILHTYDPSKAAQGDLAVGFDSDGNPVMLPGPSAYPPELLAEVSGFAKGGQFVVDEPTVGVGVHSRMPKFTIAENGPEYMGNTDRGTVQVTPMDGVSQHLDPNVQNNMVNSLYGEPAMPGAAQGGSFAPGEGDYPQGNTVDGIPAPPNSISLQQRARMIAEIAAAHGRLRGQKGYYQFLDLNGDGQLNSMDSMLASRRRFGPVQADQQYQPMVQSGELYDANFDGRINVGDQAIIANKAAPPSGVGTPPDAFGGGTPYNPNSPAPPVPPAQPRPSVPNWLNRRTMTWNGIFGMAEGAEMGGMADMGAMMGGPMMPPEMAAMGGSPPPVLDPGVEVIDDGMGGAGGSDPLMMADGPEMPTLVLARESDLLPGAEPIAVLNPGESGEPALPPGPDVGNEPAMPTSKTKKARTPLTKDKKAAKLS